MAIRHEASLKECFLWLTTWDLPKRRHMCNTEKFFEYLIWNNYFLKILETMTGSLVTLWVAKLPLNFVIFSRNIFFFLPASSYWLKH